MVEKALKFRFYPIPEQENLLRRTLGCVRLVYNKALAARTEGWYEKKERISYKQTSSMLTGWKKEEELDFLNARQLRSTPTRIETLANGFYQLFCGSRQIPKLQEKAERWKCRIHACRHSNLGQVKSIWLNVLNPCRSAGVVNFPRDAPLQLLQLN